MAHDFTSYSDETSPKYKLVFEEHPGYFFACIEANETLDDLIQEYQNKIAHQISIRKYDRVMIKRDVPITNPAVELCAVIYKVKGWGLLEIKYAFVDVNPEHIDAYKFAVLYARSREIEIEVFEDILTAEHWLLADR